MAPRKNDLLHPGQVKCRPPVLCKDCPIGEFTIYACAYKDSPDVVTERRRRIIIIEQNKIVLRQGEVPSELYTLFSGWAFKYRLLSDGRRQILSFLVPGDPIGLSGLSFPGLALPFAVRSVTKISLCAFQPIDLVTLTQSSPAQHAHFATVMQNYVGTLHDNITSLGRRSALGRVARLLVELETKLKKSGLSIRGSFDFPLSQEQIGDALGLTASHINRTLDRLRQDNIIEFDRHRMSLLNLARLHRLADEE